MSKWQTLQEEASIVFVGNFNPMIFHPEWFIRKGIYKEWDYKNDSSFICVPDISRFNLPGDQQITVRLNQFVMRAQRRSDFAVFRDNVVEVFNFLRETPLLQMGMNFTTVVSTKDADDWDQIGTRFAKRDPWRSMVSHYQELSEEKQKELGLCSMTYQIPRKDDLPGFTRAKIEIVGSPRARTLKVEINNHIEIDGDSQNTAQIATEILTDNWDSAILSSIELTEKILSQ